MSSLPLQLPTFEEQIEKIRAAAAEKGDNFRMQIRRGGQMIATFHGARVEHFVMPETWITALSGGGQYILVGYHEDAPNSIVATILPSIISGANREVDVGATSKPGWSGPERLVFPLPPAANGQSADGFFGKPGGGGTGGTAREPGVTPGIPTSGPSSEFVEARLQLFAAQAKAEREDLHRMIDAQSKAIERQVSGLAEIVKAIAMRPVEQPRPLTEQIAPLVAAFSPLVAAWSARGSEDRTAERESAARREERESRARDETMKMIMAMQDQNLKAIERNADASSNAMKMVSPMVEAVSLMGRTVVQQVATVQEMSQGPGEEGGLTGFVNSLGRGLGEYIGSRMNAPPAPPPARQLPQGQPAAGQPAAAQPAPTGQPQPAQPAEEERAATPEEIAAMDPNEIIGFLERSIREKEQPDVIADGYVQGSVNAGFLKAVADAGGPLKFFQARLGDEWVQQNQDYVRGIVAHLMQRNVKV